MPETINLLAGRATGGGPAFEEVVVERLAANEFKLLRSPGLVLGLAAGDIIATGEGGTFRLLQRGRNLCVQIFRDGGLDVLEQVLTQQLEKLGGSLDGRAGKELVYTVPVSAGFGPLEAVLRAAMSKAPGAEWYYGNVYDPVDDRPLNWWLDS